MKNRKFTLKSFVFPASIAVCLLMLVGVSRFTSAEDSQPAKPGGNTAATSGPVARGRYIVEEVAVCSNCHTPRNSGGELDHAHWLKGTSIFMQPAHRMRDWPIVAPKIAGTLPGTDAEMVTLLTTGIWNTGKPLRQPMPRFHMSREDAEAVVAYLKSLSSVNAGN